MSGRGRALTADPHPIDPRAQQDPERSGGEAGEGDRLDAAVRRARSVDRGLPATRDHDRESLRLGEQPASRFAVTSGLGAMPVEDDVRDQAPTGRRVGRRSVAAAGTQDECREGRDVNAHVAGIGLRAADADRSPRLDGTTYNQHDGFNALEFADSA